MTRSVTLVVGPPCAGKTTWVSQRAKPGDVVIDYDTEAIAAGSQRTHHHDWRYARMAAERCRQLIDDLASSEGPLTAWVIRSDAREAELLDAEVVTLVPPVGVLYDRAYNRPDPERTIRDIDRWLLNHG